MKMFKKNYLVPVLFSLLLSSCTITRYYKTKDVKKNFNKSQEQMNKAVGELSKNQTNQDMIIKRVNSFGLSRDVKRKIRSNAKKNQAVYKEIIDMRSEYKSRYSKLDLRGSRVKSNEKRYGPVKKFMDYSEGHFKKMSDKLKEYKKNAESFIETLRDHKIQFIKTSDIKKQFDGSAAQFDKNYSKVTKSIQNFKNKLNVSRHKKKNVIMGKLKEIDAILGDMGKMKKSVAKIVINFDKKYRNVKEIIFWPESKVAIALEKIKAKLGQLQGKINQFNKKTKEINDLLNS